MLRRPDDWIKELRPMKVTYIDHMGSDLTVVNAARVSFGKKSDWVYGSGSGNSRRDPYLSDQDKNLIGFLARGCTSSEWFDMKTAISQTGIDGLDDRMRSLRHMSTHWTPFGQTSVSLHFKIPIFVANQLKRHTVGFVVNELSRRYVDDDPEFYYPDEWRRRSSDKKQGSSDEVIESIQFVDPEGPFDVWIVLKDDVPELLREVLQVYRDMITGGVCPEQARMILPLSMYTEIWMTGSLYGWSRVYNQRIDLHAQKEIRGLARQIGDIVGPLFPVSWNALTM